jgi:hypothetical protein
VVLVRVAAVSPEDSRLMEIISEDWLRLFTPNDAEFPCWHIVKRRGGSKDSMSQPLKQGLDLVGAVRIHYLRGDVHNHQGLLDITTSSHFKPSIQKQRARKQIYRRVHRQGFELVSTLCIKLTSTLDISIKYKSRRASSRTDSSSDSDLFAQDRGPMRITSSIVPF